MNRILLAALAALLLAACAAGPQSTATKAGQTPEQRVAQRAEARWQALIDGRWEEAYGYLTAGYRQTHDFDAYKANFAASRVQWQGVEVPSVNCDMAERCRAQVKVRYELKGGLPGVPQFAADQQLEEVWLLSGKDWFYLPAR
ncbi:MAG: hypothetical protein WCZ65_10615 [Lysobacteraceae bacterium]